MLSLLVRLLVGLVKVLPVIGDFANRRVGSRGDLHQIEPAFPGKPDRLEWLHHAQLAAIFVHDSYFASPDSVVDSNPVRLPKTPFCDKPTSEECSRYPCAAPILSVGPLLERAARARDGSQSIARQIELAKDRAWWRLELISPRRTVLGGRDFSPDEKSL